MCVYFRYVIPSEADMCLKEFLPRMRLETKKIRPLPFYERMSLLGNLIGTVEKLIYAAIWQVCLAYIHFLEVI